MRLSFLVLLLVNAILFAWGQGHLGNPEKGREPTRRDRQLAPEKIVLLDEVAEKEAEACRRLIFPTRAAAEAFVHEAQTLAGWRSSSLQPLSEPPAYWLVVANLPNAAQAEKKKTEYQRLGAKEIEVLAREDELGPYLLSLGVFRVEAHAQALFDELTRKGARSLRLLPRELPPQRYQLELRAPAAALAERVPALLPAGVEASDCANP